MNCPWSKYIMLIECPNSTIPFSFIAGSVNTFNLAYIRYGNFENYIARKLGTLLYFNPGTISDLHESIHTFLLQLTTYLTTMANHARIEEVSDSDSDPDIMDPDEGDIMDLATFTSSNTFKGPRVTPPNRNQTLTNPSNIPSTAQRAPPPQPQFDPAKSKHWHCIYPIYFDELKTRHEGRRVGKNGAVKNPLARTILEAVARLGLNVVFEPQKIHPKDWANPGRVRVELKDENGRIKRPNVKNSMCSQPIL